MKAPTFDADGGDETVQSGFHVVAEPERARRETLRIDARVIEALAVIATAENLDEVEHQLAAVRGLAGEAEIAPLVRSLEKRASEVAALRQMALTDPRTGVANRRAFDDTLTREIGRAERDGSALSIIMLDLDRLKFINDNLGHAEGDRAIEMTARACVDVTRCSDLVGRMGGDEFAVLLPGADLEQARAVAERLRDAIESCSIGSETLRVSIGIATYPTTVSNPESLLRAADIELYRDKRSRKGGKRAA